MTDSSGADDKGGNRNRASSKTLASRSILGQHQLPATMLVDYIWARRPENMKNIGCDPPEFPRCLTSIRDLHRTTLLPPTVWRWVNKNELTRGEACFRRGSTSASIENHIWILGGQAPAWFDARKRPASGTGADADGFGDQGQAEIKLPTVYPVQATSGTTPRRESHCGEARPNNQSSIIHELATFMSPVDAGIERHEDDSV
ncbi:hypothetical protein BKA82DRAFT_4341040 [Pisolithus tinctorius]|nr:hypothetical protein BKA82DRAFT_4341040 [Pisolithus tinctorius]